MTDIYQEITRVRAEGEEAALVTVILARGSTPREAGASSGDRRGHPSRRPHS